MTTPINKINKINKYKNIKKRYCAHFAHYNILLLLNMDDRTKSIVYLSSVVAAAQIYNSIRAQSSIIGREALVAPDASSWSRLYEVILFFNCITEKPLMLFFSLATMSHSLALLEWTEQLLAVW